MPALLLALLLVVASGCAHRKSMNSYGSAQSGEITEPALNRPDPVPGKPGLIVTPENQLTGKIAMVNPAGRFVVINFPVGHMPAIDQRLNLYRRGLKVGEVKITGPQQDDNIVGDLVTGDSEIGDEARAQ